MIGSLIGANTNGGHADVVYIFGNIVSTTSNQTFMLRINSALRKLGVISVTCHKDHLTIYCRGNKRIDIHYPENMDNLQDSIESELRLQTELFESNIRTIGCYISEYAGQIKRALTQIK